MKKLAAVLLALLFCLPAVSAGAEGDGSQLRALLLQETGADAAFFAEYDYDGDGFREAFALVGSADGEFGYDGDLWYVSEAGCQRLQSGLAYMDLKTLGSAAPILFAAEEGYGGSGSTSHVWLVADAQPVELAGDQFEGIAAGDAPCEYYMFPGAFDAFTDGTGHTWKRYYFYLDGQQLREYGGLRISEADFRSLEGADDILDAELAEGKALMDVIYRDNGVINLNFLQEDANTNVTVRVADGAVTYWEADSGVYELASNPSIAVYPSGFPYGSGNAQTPAAANKETAVGLNKEPSDASGNKETAEKPAPVPAAEPVEEVVEAPAVEPVEETAEAPAEEAPAAQSPSFLEELTVEEGTAGLYTERKENEYGDMEDGLYVGVYNASGELTDSRALLTWPAGMLAQGGGINAFLWKVGDGLYFAEARFAWEGITANYLLFRHAGSALVYVTGAQDPGYSSGEALQDGADESVLFESEEFDQEGMLAALNGHFAADGITFAMRVVDMGSGYGEARVYSAQLPDSALLATAVISSGKQEAAPEEEAAGEGTEGEYSQEYGEEYGEPEGGYDEASFVFTTGDVNVRTGPGLGYEVLGQLGKGTRAVWLGETSVDERGVAWYMIDYFEDRGWVSSMYSELEEGDYSGAYGGGEEYDYVYGRQVRASGNMNLRSEPNLDGKVLTVVTQGDYAEYLEESSVDNRGVRWYLVNYRGLTGWVSSTYAVLEN